MFFSASTSALYGIKGVFSPFVVPQPSDRPMIFMDTVLNSLFVFGGPLTSELFDNNMFEFSFESNMWRWIHGPGVSGDLGTVGELGVESPLNVPRARAAQAHFTISSLGELTSMEG
jgi:hypothetical protein